jgi:hypothetical protein
VASARAAVYFHFSKKVGKRLIFHPLFFLQIEAFSFEKKNDGKEEHNYGKRSGH